MFHAKKFDFDDFGIPGVMLLLQKGNESHRCQTSASGYCLVPSLQPGDWEVSIDLSGDAAYPEDTQFLETRKMVTVQEAATYNVSLLAKTVHVLKGEIFLDNDRNSRFSEGDIHLKQVGLILETRRTSSDSNGLFLIRDVKPGNYTLRVTGGIPGGSHISEGFLQVFIPRESGVVEIHLPVWKKE